MEFHERNIYSDNNFNIISDLLKIFPNNDPENLLNLLLENNYDLDQIVYILEDNELNDKINNELMECQCCSQYFYVYNLFQCSEGDLFCVNCLKGNIQGMLSGNMALKDKIPCLNFQDKCCGIFHESTLEKFFLIEEQLAKRYNDAIISNSILKSEIQVVNCYNCPFKCETGEDSGNILYCIECYESTCLLCKNKAH